MKRFRDIMTYWGGDSSKKAQANKVKQTRFKLVSEAANGVEAVYQAYDVHLPRTEASWVRCMKMQVAADVLASQRPQQAELDRKSGKRQATKRARAEARDSLKQESIASLLLE